MYGTLQQELAAELDGLREARLYKGELVLETPQSPHVEVEGMGALLNLCANNYLGLADHPEIVAAAREALDRWGFGMASVRFICGTQTLHRELEQRLSEFLGTEDTILFSSCFDANGGLFEALLGAEDAVISDALNHASIIDGIRLCKAQRLRYANGDLDELEARLEESDGAHSNTSLTKYMHITRPWPNYVLLIYWGRSASQSRRAGQPDHETVRPPGGRLHSLRHCRHRHH